MEANLEETEIRVILIGSRWAGKSSSGNTILRKERFECGRTRTAQSEVRHGLVDGRKLTVIDAPGWSGSLSLAEIPEGDKQRFKLNASKCPPGPNAFLLVIPIDSAFSVEQKTSVEEHMKLLGERVWRYTMVLFTCGDYLGEKTIEEHIESEGQALKWLIEKCLNRYHVFNNKDKINLSQVTKLLQKIEEMVWYNGGSYYNVEEHIFQVIKEKQKEVAERAEERRKKAEDQRQHMKTLIPEEMKHIPKLQMILLGSRNVGKTSVGNTILGYKDQEDGKRTPKSVACRGFVAKTEIILVDTPGWWKGFPVFDTPEAIKDELMRSMFLCPPGPHVFLLVIDADASFNAKHLDAVTSHVELLGDGVWRHTIIVFTRGDWLGTNSIEQYIEGEGEALQSLVEQCGNRYHVVDHKNASDGTQISELLEKITETVAANGWSYFVPDQQIFQTLEERRRKVKEGAMLRQSQVKATRESLGVSSNKLQELRIILLGQKTVGKSATGNTLLHKEVFASSRNEQCQMQDGEVSGRRVTVIDTPGWWQDSSCCTDEIDKEIARGFSLSPAGVHVILLVIPLDLTFRDYQRVTLENHMNLFHATVWKHAMVLFTYGDKLADKSLEEHIEREHSALRWVIEKCENRYHAINNLKKMDMNQVTELFEKIEEIVAGNSGKLFCPNMNEMHLRIEETFKQKQLKHVLKQRLVREYGRRELELMKEFKETLHELQNDIRGGATGTKSKSLVGDRVKLTTRSTGQGKRDGKEEKLDTKISQKIKKLDDDIEKLSHFLGNSKEFLIPDFKGSSPAPSIPESFLERKQSTGNFEKVLSWLSNLHIGTNVENQLTLNFSQTSGYRSMVPSDTFDFDREVEVPE
ncbi:GTPase IMAP family member 8 isoform X2 [Haplochromis burtoni]|uniref:GTPase IMAP family member 8 isoform X2 n=1 Tax=Haplochromis burtoni TaxID=8153 RepID=UPI001C2D7504|nr:GTPase IMAP family member 8 isoform X2 [Haplochromis burtoni]